MSSRFTCYLLTYAMAGGRKRRYWGMTELLGTEDQDEACEVRLRNHIRRPLLCNKGAVTSTMVIVPQGPVLTEKNCLAQEAIFAATAAASDWTARGACFSSPTLGPALRAAVQHVVRATRGLGGQEARRAVIDFAASLDEGHPLVRHLGGQCYKCGGKFGRCGCRFSGYRGRPRQGPPKSRSGTSLSGSTKRKLLGLTPADPMYYQLKWGADVAENRRADNQKQNARNPDRPRGQRSRRSL